MHSSARFPQMMAVLAAVLCVAGCGEPPQPVIEKVDPPTQQIERVVTISGRDLGGASTDRSLTIGGVVAPAVSSWEDTHVVAGVPASVEGKVAVVVTVEGRASKPADLTVTIPDPTIGNVEPAPAIAGEKITIRGRHFGTAHGRVLIEGAADAQVQSWASTEIVATLPKGITQAQIKVIRSGRASNVVTVEIVRPVVFSLTPKGVVPGRTITIKGAQFGDGRRDGKVLFEGVEGITYKSWSDTKIEAVAPESTSELKKGKLVVHARNTTSEPREFLLAGMPPDGPVAAAEKMSGPWNQIRLDADGLPLLFHQSNFYAEARLLKWDGFSWSMEKWDAPFLHEGLFRKGFGIGLRVVSDAPDDYYLICLNNFDQSVILCRRKSGKWSMEPILPAPKVRSWKTLAIGVTKEGAPIGFRFTEESGLSIFWRDKTGWVEQALDPGGGEAQDAAQVTLSQDESRGFHVAWLSPPTGELRYTTNLGGQWKIQTVDTGNVGGWPSIACGPGGQLAIAYCDNGRKHLKVAQLVGGTWVTETVDASANTGRWTSLAIDKKGKLHVAYTDEAKPGLRYATNRSGAWKIVAPLGKSHPANYTSIVLDKHGKALICWHDYEKEQLNLWHER